MSIYSGTHKAKVKHFSTMARIFLPIGIVLLAFLVIGLATGIPLFYHSVVNIVEESGSTANDVNNAFSIVWAWLLIAFGIVSGVFGLPLFVLSFVFRTLARSAREEDIANGVDYSSFPYGK